MRFFPVLICLCFLCAFSSATAQETALSRPDVTASGEAYLKAVRYRGLDTNVVYFDPTQPAPPLDTTFKPDSTQTPATEETDNRWITLILSLIVLGFVIAFLYVAAGRISVSFGSDKDNPRRSAKHNGTGSESDNGAAPDLETILRNKDRDQAVIGLAQLALSRCLSANKILFKRSWTHREALRSLPQSQWYIPDLRALVLASERVHFGHRSISERDFDALLRRIAPVLQQVQA